MYEKFVDLLTDFHPQKAMDLFLDFRLPKARLNKNPLPITDAELPSLLSFSLVGLNGSNYEAQVEQGEQVMPGRFLAKNGKRPAVMSPVKGKVVSVASAPDTRCSRSAQSILIEPDPKSAPAVFEPLDDSSEGSAKLWARIEEAGILTDSPYPRVLGELIGPKSEGVVETLVILAADREPQVCSALSLLMERSEDAAACAAMLGKMTSAVNVVMAVAKPVAEQVAGFCARAKVEVMPLPAHYPESLDELVAQRAGGGEGVKVVALETGLAALDAIREGKVQDRKVVTVIGPEGQAQANLRVVIGTRVNDLLDQLKINLEDGDKVVLGGPMRGFPQYSLEGSIDAGIDAVMVIPEKYQIKWSDEPCINCGTCVSSCPVNLQVQFLGRYAEFSLFEQTEEYSIESCIECGLCASVCPARRPLLQWIRLAKEQLAEQQAQAMARQAEAGENEG